MKRTTLCFPVVDKRVLLAMKKRGFGEGKWNGAGGKLHTKESPEDACRREAFEEFGIRLGTLEDRGIIHFIFKDQADWSSKCHIFVTRNITGTPVETNEMRPQWFDFDAVPYADMWEADALWLPGVLAGGRVGRTYQFDASQKLILPP